MKNGVVVIEPVSTFIEAEGDIKPNVIIIFLNRYNI